MEVIEDEGEKRPPAQRTTAAAFFTSLKVGGGVGEGEKGGGGGRKGFCIKKPIKPGYPIKRLVNILTFFLFLYVDFFIDITRSLFKLLTLDAVETDLTVRY